MEEGRSDTYHYATVEKLSCRETLDFFRNFPYVTCSGSISALVQGGCVGGAQLARLRMIVKTVLIVKTDVSEV